MIKDGDIARAKACYAPEVSLMAKSIFNLLNKYKEVASKLTIGMDIKFQGLDKIYLKKVAKSFHNIDIVRYDYFIDVFEVKIREQYDKKRK